ncbi:Gfo/Idh/MocA family oxidoreductase [Streptomyces sp. NPDC050619]|uniref:Gfo/Idh/MocA family protein n=1 Tax=Streptomyces sp. NPDC050619 TaxID=3157214 RepID=UPI0034254A27
MSVTVGVLGAARVVRPALLEPAAAVEGIEVTAVAARDEERAIAFAGEHGIPRVFRCYDEIVDAPDVDALYVPTPAALHGHWMRRAIKAGKHVLCEKPFTANAEEAAAIAELAESSGLVVMEAFHSRHHPMWTRMRDILDSGVLGRLHTARAEFSVPHPDPTDIRWQRHLGGGALMDLGCYPVRLLRHLFGEPEVIEAQARDIDGVDISMAARLAFAGAVSGEVVVSMEPTAGPVAELRVIGLAGDLHVRMPYHPYMYGELTLTTDAGVVTEPGDPRTSYSFQLAAFRDAVSDNAPVLTNAREATATMRVIDAVYHAAGLSPRAPLTPSP